MTPVSLRLCSTGALSTAPSASRCHSRGLTARQCRLAPNKRAASLRVAADASDASGAAPLKYLYDGECPLRRPEVEMLKRLDGGKGRIDFVDIANLEYNPQQNAGITYEDAMGAPAAILSDGTVIRSVEVYRRLYEAVGLGFVWTVAELPVVGGLVTWVFNRTVEYRLPLTGRPALSELVAARSASPSSAATPSGEGRPPSEADSFLASPGGKFISWLGNTVTASPLNEGKIRLAKLQARGYDPSLARSKMEAVIESNKVVVFSFSTCPFCVKAKALLEELGVEYAALELNEMGKEGYAIRYELAKETGRTSMPNIWIDGQCIGGCNDGPGLLALHKEGQLEPLLETAGIFQASKP